MSHPYPSKGDEMSPPPEWLVEWTKWLGLVLSIIIGLIGLWKGNKLVDRAISRQG
jgi:hypothetical protein